MKKMLLFLSVVAASGLAWTYKMKSESRYSLEELNAIALEASKALPVMVDATTRLERVVAHDGVLEKQYTLVSARLVDVDAVSFNRQMSASLISQSCANEQSRTLYKAGVSEWFTYSDVGGNVIATFKVGRDSCSA